MSYRLVLVICMVLAACGKNLGKPEKKTEKATEPALLLSSEDLVTVSSTALASGPTITGSIQPERRADLRAELSAVVLQVLKENGDQVRRGELLVRLDDTAIRDSLASAEATARSTQQAFEQAERQLQRIKSLRASGMASVQQLDDAEQRRNNALSDFEAAKTRAVAARQQLQRTEVRAPFDGIVSERKASVGDTAQIGKELLKVIDPSSMRLEGLIPADHIGNVKVGQAVNFRVNGYGEQEFRGKIRRVNPSANPTTRQVEVLVDLTDQKPPRLAGLYAEGRIETASSAGFAISESIFVRDGGKTFVWRIENEALQKAPISIGERDPRTGRFAVLGGLNEGDKLLRYPTVTLKEGQKIELITPYSSRTSAVTSPTDNTTR